MWECGLKQLYIPYFYLFQRHSLCGSVDWNQSTSCRYYVSHCHSLCGSVDWNIDYQPNGFSSRVTPYVGVWIETCMLIYFCTYLKSLLMWECGLKHSKEVVSLTTIRHSLCGSVDWNLADCEKWYGQPMSLLMWECGLKQFAGGEADHPVGGHSLCGSVDWNLNEMPYLRIHAVTPYVGVWIET